MHETTRALLQGISKTSDNNEYGPAECWREIGPLVFDWREAGRPGKDLLAVPVGSPPHTDAPMLDYDLLRRSGRDAFRKHFVGLLRASLPWKVVQSVIMWGGEVWAKPEYRIFTFKDHPQAKAPMPIITTIEIEHKTYILIEGKNAHFIQTTANAMPGLLRRLDDQEEALVRALDGNLDMARLAVAEPERLSEITKLRDRLFTVARQARKADGKSRDWRIRTALARVGELEELLGLVDGSDTPA